MEKIWENEGKLSTKSGDLTSLARVGRGRSHPKESKKWDEMCPR